MSDFGAVSSVNMADRRGPMTNTADTSHARSGRRTQAASRQDVNPPVAEQSSGALANFSDGLREFAFGVLSPGSGLVGEKTYETLVSQTMDNIKREYDGALSGFCDNLRNLAQDVLSPDPGGSGESGHKGSHSVTMENLNKQYQGVNAELRRALREYAELVFSGLAPEGLIDAGAKDSDASNADGQQVNLMI